MQQVSFPWWKSSRFNDWAALEYVRYVIDVTF